jgi:hypothetical protein
VRKDGLLAKHEKLPTSRDRAGFQIIEYDPARSDGAIQRYESRFGEGGHNKWTYDSSRRTDGLVEMEQFGRVLVERYDPAKAKTVGLYTRVYDPGNSESWHYKEGTQPNGLVKETRRYAKPYGYEKEFAGRPDRLVRREWNKDLRDTNGAEITIQTYAGGRQKRLHDWELETELRNER